MTNDDKDARVIAAEPTAGDTTGAEAVGDGARPHGTTPRDAAAAEDRIDEASAGDGVAFFEGGDGREEARTDIERSG